VIAGSNPPPTVRNLHYGPDFEQTLDFYRSQLAGPTPVAVYIHGGGWHHLDKTEVTELFHCRELLDAGISIVSINYRFCPPVNPSPTVPAVAVPMHDCARAIQFVRSRAKEWGLDGKRLGIFGTSAGATSALWLALHSDLAEPLAADKIARESTRPLCVVAFAPQTSLDPAQMQAWVGPGINYGAHAFGIGPRNDPKASFAKFLAARESLLPWIKEYSDAALLTRDGPPVFLDYRDLTLELHRPLGDSYTHSPRFGIGFDDLAQKLGRECYLRYPGHIPDRYATWQKFMVAKLTSRVD
jgi:acetyl esterase/lipase